MTTPDTESKLPGDTLTVIFRNDAPMYCCGDTPSYRSVRIKLTPDQRAELSFRHVCTTGGQPMFEEISHAFIEPPEEVEE